MLRLSPLESAPRQARRALAAWLDENGATPEPALDVVLLVSELVADAVAHGPAGEVLVRADRRDGGVEVEVVTAPQAPVPFALADERGGGARPELAIVGALCEGITVQRDRTGHHRVLCWVPLE